MPVYKITDVPNSRVDERKREYERDGASVKVTDVTAQTSTLIVTYPDAPAPTVSSGGGGQTTSSGDAIPRDGDAVVDEPEL
jgi:hypothetical protein